METRVGYTHSSYAHQNGKPLDEETNMMWLYACMYVFIYIATKYKRNNIRTGKFSSFLTLTAFIK